MIIRKIKRFISEPYLLPFRLDEWRIITLPDDKYLKYRYRIQLGKNLDLDNPKTFDEKMQWLKLNDRNPKYTQMVDKYEAKKYVSEIIGDEYIIPTLGIYNSYDEIDFDKLPNQFVIKCTHDSGSIVLCKDKKIFDKEKYRDKINKALKTNYYHSGREWPYKEVKPRILIEKYMEDKKTRDLKDYKFFTFNSVTKCIQVDYDRFTNHKRAYYDTSWKRLPFTTCYPSDYSIEIDKPDNFEEMKKIVDKITSTIENNKFLRVDLYSINEKIYFGELTFYPGSGFEKFFPEEWDYKLGEMIDISMVDNNEK